MNELERIHHFTLLSKYILYSLSKLKELIQEFDTLYSLDILIHELIILN